MKADAAVLSVSAHERFFAAFEHLSYVDSDLSRIDRALSYDLYLVVVSFEHNDQLGVTENRDVGVVSRGNDLPGEPAGRRRLNVSRTHPI